MNNRKDIANFDDPGGSSLVPLGSDHLPSVGASPSALGGFEATPTAVSLLYALRRRYKLVLGLGSLLACLVAALAWFLTPPSKYTARALLQVSSSQPKMIFKTEENRVDFQTYQKTQITLLRSRNLLNKALNDPRVSKLGVAREQVDPVLWLEKQVQADYLGEVFRISMSGNKPDDLAVIVNAVTDAYLKEVVAVESSERWARHDQLKKIYDEYQANLKSRRDQLKSLARNIGSNNTETIRYTQELSLDRLSSARRELVQITSELRRAKAELEIRLARERDGAVAVASVPEAAIQQFVADDEEVKQHNARIGQLKTAIARVERIARDGSDPALKAKVKELESVRKALAARVASLRPLALERSQEVASSGEDQSVRTLRDRVGVLEQLVKVTQAIYDEQSAESHSISKDSFYIEDIKDQIGHADNAAKRIGEELEALTVELKAPSRVRQLESADAPRKEDDKRVPIAGMAGLGTFGLFAFGIAFLEFRTRRISSIDEVTQWLGLRVVGALPPIHTPGRRWKRAVRGPDPRDGILLTESIDSIRTMILHSTGDRSLGSIMVTSATGGEGKTSLACHLATSLARSGMKTLLIDCDLRKPTIHRLFDVPATPGFSEYLRREAKADEVVRATSVDGPDVVAAGVCDARALRALARADAGGIFEAFRGSHDIIVVDTSPILPVTDALLVGRHVDAAIYSVLRDVSRLPWTHAAVARLKLMNVRLLGVVVTGVRPHLYGPYYHDYAGGVRHD